MTTAACPGANTTDTGEYACANCCFLSEEDAAGGHIWVEESGSDESESEADKAEEDEAEWEKDVAKLTNKLKAESAEKEGDFR